MSSTFDVLIVGGGIVGAAAARECAREGLRTGIVEQGVVSGAATAAGMGHIVIMDDSPAQLALTRFSRALWQREVLTLPAAVEYESRGTLWIAEDDEQMAEAVAKQSLFAQAGVASAVLSSAELAVAEPNLRCALAGALLVPDDAVIYPPAAGRHFLDEALRLGTELVAARAVQVRDGEVRLNEGSSLYANQIVLASGADRELLPSLPVQRRKGHLVITDRYPGFVHHQLLELGYLKSAHTLSTDSVAFNVQPRQTGQLLIGSSRQYGSVDPHTEPEIVRRMLERACHFMPGLGQLSALRVWTGFRAATADKLPFIGSAAELSDDPSLWLLSGFEGLGITNAPGAARLLVDAMLGRESDIDRTPYLASRLRAAVPEPAHA